MKYDWLDAYLLSLPGVEKDYKQIGRASCRERV